MVLKMQLKMITYSALIVILFVAFSYLFQNLADAKTIGSDQSAVRIVRMHLQGLVPGKIESARKTLMNVPGVVEVKIDPEHRVVTVMMDIARTDLRTIERSLQQAGFTPLYR